KPALTEALAKAHFAAPQKPVYSNTTAVPHPADGKAIAAQLAEHLVSPVRFVDEVRAMYDAGARVFIEVGPHAVLTGLTGQILNGSPHVAVATDSKSRPGLVQLAHAVGQLLTAGVPANLDRLFAGRGVQPFELAKLSAETGKPKPPATAWVVNGVRSRPINGPEPRLLGQALPAGAKAKEPVAPATPAPPKSAPAPTAAPVAAAPVAVAKPAPAPVVPSTTSQPARPPMHTHTTPAPSVNGNGHAHAPAAQPAPEGAAAVMMRFQEVMARFVDTQKSVMLAYLGAPQPNGHAAPAPFAPVTVAQATSTPLAVPVPVNRIADVARPPVTVAVPVAPPVAKAETNGKHAPAPKPAATPAPAAPVVEAKKADAPKPAALDRDSMLAKLLDLVSDRTGYPKEALSIDLDLEADLGVDSIKRVEILGSLAETIEAGSDGKQPNLEMEKLSVIKTLRGIADYVMGALADAAAPAAPVAEKPAAV
ncbi:MAG: hypothetical protein K2X91_18100, partial [Thermoleophilia bacterium]|nr:hypothetical protein [Thermoleophilia bacterium]